MNQDISRRKHIDRIAELKDSLRDILEKYDDGGGEDLDCAIEDARLLLRGGDPVDGVIEVGSMEEANKVMVKMCDPYGMPRAWAILDDDNVTEETVRIAEDRARKELEAYCSDPVREECNPDKYGKVVLFFSECRDSGLVADSR
jgi:hypothetical protein